MSMARFKTGMMAGFFAGYVIGAKAGRERYEQIVRGWRRVRGTRAYQRASEKVGEAIGSGFKRSRVVAFDGLNRASSLVRERRVPPDF
jgi:hypothetical protein